MLKTFRKKNVVNIGLVKKCFHILPIQVESSISNFTNLILSYHMLSKRRHFELYLTKIKFREVVQKLVKILKRFVIFWNFCRKNNRMSCTQQTFTRFRKKSMKLCKRCHDIAKELNIYYQISLNHLKKDWLQKETHCLGTTKIIWEKFNGPN